MQERTLGTSGLQVSALGPGYHLTDAIAADAIFGDFRSVVLRFNLQARVGL